MSYSRWSNSAWYSFYNVSSGDTRDEQVLSLWYDMDHIIDLTYADLQDVTAASIVEMYDCTDAEADEAMQYIAYFMQDAEEEYPDALQILDKIDKIGEPR